MSERRRSLFVLLIVVALIGGSIAVVATKPTVLGLDLQGGVAARLQGRADRAAAESTPTPCSASIDLMQQRVNEFGVSEAEVFQSGNDQIEVNVPGVSDAERRRRPGRLHRPAVLLRLGSEHPRRGVQDRPGPEREPAPADQRPARRGHAGVQVHGASASARASTRSPTTRPAASPQAAAKPRFYVFDKNDQEAARRGGQTFDSREDALDSLTDAEQQQRRGHRGPGRRARAARADATEPDDPKPGPLVGHPGPPGPLRHRHQEPGAELRHDGRQRADRHLQLHRRGPRGVPGDHAPRRRARRRQRVRPATRIQTSQHFAIALDNELVSAPYINWRENPDGIDGATGAQISGSFTIQSAQDLAKILKIGALPLKLTEVSRSQVSATLGKQALDQGLKAGIAGFIIVALFLIIFYRVLGVDRDASRCASTRSTSTRSSS